MLMAAAVASSAGGDGGRLPRTSRPLVDVTPSAFVGTLGMSSKKFVWHPEHWRFRAEEARTVADQMTHEESRTIMRRIAMDYDRLAKLAEVQLIQEATERKT